MTDVKGKIIECLRENGPMRTSDIRDLIFKGSHNDLSSSHNSTYNALAILRKWDDVVELERGYNKEIVWGLPGQGLPNDLPKKDTRRKRGTVKG